MALSGVTSRDSERIQPLYFTLYISSSQGEWYDWQESRWSPIRSIDKNEYVLKHDGILWDLTINRITGDWQSSPPVVVPGEPQSLSGTCKKISLRVPPAQKF
jgi:hypothetical protein